MAEQANYQGEHLGLSLNRDAVFALNDALEQLRYSVQDRASAAVPLRLPDGRTLQLRLSLTNAGEIRDASGDYLDDDGIAHADVTGDLAAHFEARQVLDAASRPSLLLELTNEQLDGTEPVALDQIAARRAALAVEALPYRPGRTDDWVQRLRTRAATHARTVLPEVLEREQRRHVLAEREAAAASRNRRPDGSGRPAAEVDAEVSRLVEEIEAAGGSRLEWPASQTSGRYGLDFNSGVFADPYLAGTRYFDSEQAARAYADAVLPRLRALEEAARGRPDFDDRGTGEFRAYATVVSERRDPDSGDAGDPVHEHDYDPDPGGLAVGSAEREAHLMVEDSQTQADRDQAREDERVAADDAARYRKARDWLEGNAPARRRAGEGRPCVQWPDPGAGPVSHAADPEGARAPVRPRNRFDDDRRAETEQARERRGWAVQAAADGRDSHAAYWTGQAQRWDEYAAQSRRAAIAEAGYGQVADAANRAPQVTTARTSDAGRAAGSNGRSGGAGMAM